MAGSAAMEARTRADSARRIGLWRARVPSYSLLPRPVPAPHPGDHRDARPDRRLERLHAGALPGRQPPQGAARSPRWRAAGGSRPRPGRPRPGRPRSRRVQLPPTAGAPVPSGRRHSSAPARGRPGQARRHGRVPLFPAIQTLPCLITLRPQGHTSTGVSLTGRRALTGRARGPQPRARRPPPQRRRAPPARCGACPRRRTAGPRAPTGRGTTAPG